MHRRALSLVGASVRARQGAVSRTAVRSFSTRPDVASDKGVVKDKLRNDGVVYGNNRQDEYEDDEFVLGRKKKFNPDKYPDGITSTVLAVNRTQKVTKGGLTMSYSALVVAGNMRGAAGYGTGKHDVVSNAVDLAFENAWNNFVYVDRFKDQTLYHDVEGRYGSAKVTIRPARPGTGLRAGGIVAAALHAFGIHDASAKSHGQRNAWAVTRATFNALQSQRSATTIGEGRGKRFVEI